MGMGPVRDVLDPELLESVAAEIGVDAATVAKIKTLVYGANRDAIDLRAEVQRQRLALRQLLEDERPDVKKVLKQVEAVGSAETSIRKNRVQLILAVRDLLTPEQRQKLQRVMAERRGAVRGAGPGWWGGPGDLD